MQGANGYVTVREAAEMEGVGYWAFFKRIQRGGPSTHKENGVLKIPISGLSPQAQEKYKMIRETTTERRHHHADVHHLSKKKRDAYFRRIEILREASRLRGPAREEYLREHGVPASTYYDWRRKKTEAGLEGLVDPRGGSEQKLSTATQAALAYLYLRPERPTITEVSRQFLATQTGQTQGLPLPTIHQVRRYLESLPEAVRLRYRQGIEAYKNFAEIFAERDYTSLAPGEYWTSDHTQIDVAVRDPLSGRAHFPWITIIMDIRSRKILGWFIGNTPSGRTIAAAMGRALKHYQPPQKAILDNGMDYRSHYISGGIVRIKKGRLDIDSETKGVLANLHIDVQWAIVKNAQSKPCERWFRRLKEELLRTLPGYRGGRIWERPEELQRTLKSGKLLSIQELESLMARWVDDYNNAPHGGHGMDGKSPNEIYVVENPPLVNPDTLTLLMMPFARRKVYRLGIKFMGGSYYAPILQNLLGHPVDVRWDPQEIGRLAVFDLSGAFVCWAEHLKRLSFNASQEDVAAVMSAKKSQRKSHEDFYRNVKENLENPDILERVVTARRHIQPGPQRGRLSTHTTVAGRFRTEHDAAALKMKVAKELKPWEQMVPPFPPLTKGGRGDCPPLGETSLEAGEGGKKEKFYFFECEKEEEEA